MLGAVTYFRLWGYLWREWFTSVDHKKIGIMYIILGIVMLLRGFADALMMRLQQAWAFGASEGYLNAHHYDQVFTAHGTIMIFFVAIPLIVGIVNYVMPLQIGARDVAFPFLNSLSLWLTVAGALLVMVVAVRRRVQSRRLAQLRAGGESREQPRYRAGLLPLGAADRRRRHDAVRHQHGDHHLQDAGAGHDVDEDAGVHLDGAVQQRARHRDLPDAHRWRSRC